MTFELSRSVSDRQDRTRIVSQTARWLQRRGYDVLTPAGGLWHLIGLGARDVVAVRIVGRWPSRSELDRLAAHQTAAWVRKIIMRWKPGARTPDVRVLDQPATMKESPADYFASKHPLKPPRNEPDAVSLSSLKRTSLSRRRR